MTQKFLSHNPIQEACGAFFNKTRPSQTYFVANGRVFLSSVNIGAVGIDVACGLRPHI